MFSCSYYYYILFETDIETVKDLQVHPLGICLECLMIFFLPDILLLGQTLDFYMKCEWSSAISSSLL